MIGWEEIPDGGRREPGRLSPKIRGALAIAVGSLAVLLPACSSHSGQFGSAVVERQCAGPIEQGQFAKAVGTIATKLVFVSNRSGSYRIYEKNLATGGMDALTPNGSNAMNPQLSPDRQRLVFYTDSSGSNQIATFPLGNPGDVTQLTHDSGGVQDYDPVYTPDGHILYKKTDAHGNYGDIWEMNADGAGQHDVTQGLIGRHIEAWKPVPLSNAEAVITERTRQDDPYSDNLYDLNLHGGRTQPLTENNLSNWYPDYDAGGQRLVFITKQEQSQHDVLATMRSDGLDCKVIVTLPGNNNDPSWSIDGQHIVFVNNHDGDYSTYMSDADGTTLWLLDRSPKGSDDLSPLLLG